MEPFNADHPKYLLDEILCIADTKWVLGHWYIKAIQNGRSLTDFNALAAMSQDQLGHVRALFSLLEQSFQLKTNWLEFERSITDIHSMELLDEPPINWADFIVSTWLGEHALLTRFTATKESGDGLSALALQCAEECEFHILYLDGSLDGFSQAEKLLALESFAIRQPLASRWFIEASETVRLAFDKKCSELKVILGASNNIQPVNHTNDLSWDSARSRTANSAMPSVLWEFILPTSEQAVMCRRPLMVSTDDGIRFGNI
jgi:1,2-phenylacetyl-CoA epoxidase catalytic subunit